MAEELWRPSLDLALHRNRVSQQARLVQLATVREDGRPAVRTVVFRGFFEETHRLTFASDTRSTKVAQLELSPWSEACWYFPLTREQFRLTGVMHVAGEDCHDRLLSEARTGLWRELTEESRLAYAWPEPGRAREPLRPYPASIPDVDLPPPHFCLLVLEPHEVDHLELQGNPQHRWKYARDDRGRWSGVEINP